MGHVKQKEALDYMQTETIQITGNGYTFMEGNSVKLIKSLFSEEVTCEGKQSKSYKTYRAHDFYTMSHQRRCIVMTMHRR